ncbi:MAG: hypothetical protein ACR2GW_06055 [Pyrinomonadaceae bacterium]|nr:hypothetical protein [Acidobacteriota bacterium]
MRNSFQTKYLTLLLLCLVGCAAAVKADVKIKSKSTSGGQITEQVTYIKGKRQRSELNPALATIMQCDLRRTITLSEPSQTYVVTPFDQNNGADSAPAQDNGTAANQPASARRGGAVTTTITHTDTGERKKMFGYIARRIKTLMVTESSPDACEPTRSRMEQDGWYIDAAFALDCGGQNAAAYVPRAKADGCRDQYRTKQSGAVKLGYPVLVTTTLYDEKNQPSFSFSQEVIEISTATLDDALFDVPANYKQVRDQQELFSASASKIAGDDEDNSPAGSSSTGTSNTNAQGPANSSAMADGPKKAGMIRIGVATPQATTGEGLDAATFAETVRATMINQLRGPVSEAVALAARSPQQIEAEAQAKECDFVLYTTAMHKKGGGGGFGSFLRKAAPVVDAVPVGGSTSAAVADTAARTVIYTAANIASSVKAKDELTLEYKLQRAGNGATPIAAQTLKAKAKSDGEDLISKLTAQAAPVVLVAATKK